MSKITKLYPEFADQCKTWLGWCAERKNAKIDRLSIFFC